MLHYARLLVGPCAPLIHWPRLAGAGVAALTGTMCRGALPRIGIPRWSAASHFSPGVPCLPGVSRTGRNLARRKAPSVLLSGPRGLQPFRLVFPAFSSFCRLSSAPVSVARIRVSDWEDGDDTCIASGRGRAALPLWAAGNREEIIRPRITKYNTIIKPEREMRRGEIEGGRENGERGKGGDRGRERVEDWKKKGGRQISVMCTKYMLCIIHTGLLSVSRISRWAVLFVSQ